MKSMPHHIPISLRKLRLRKAKWMAQRKKVDA
jgi:hypothetical protein